MHTPILHIVPSQAWERAQREGTYRGDTLDAEGFIHFSSPDQVVRVANARFQGHTGLLLLIVDPEKLTSPLKFEPPFEDNEGNEVFPHLYGALNLDAVIQVLEFPPNADGTFSLPNAPMML